MRARDGAPLGQDRTYHVEPTTHDAGFQMIMRSPLNVFTIVTCTSIVWLVVFFVGKFLHFTLPGTMFRFYKQPGLASAKASALKSSLLEAGTELQLLEYEVCASS